MHASDVRQGQHGLFEGLSQVALYHTSSVPREIALLHRSIMDGLSASMRVPTPPHTSRSGTSLHPLLPTDRTAVNPRRR